MTSDINQKPALNRYGINCIARHVSMAVITSALLFLGAGTLDWSWGWVFSLVYLLCWLGLSAALARWNPELLNERGKRRRDLVGTKSWDWVLLSIYSLVILGQPFVAGLDWRYQWSAPSSSIVYILGNLLMIAGMALLTWSMVVNRFFEATVRLQDQRGHQVITSGPYRYVRHPGYSALMLTFIAVPIALGAWAALIPALIGIVDFIIRTAMEDRTLQAELPGYADFSKKTRYRLLPGIW
jgi:protein-S-isoprenylcysteine O-methyltransferase Ste14